MSGRDGGNGFGSRQSSSFIITARLAVLGVAVCVLAAPSAATAQELSSEVLEQIAYLSGRKLERSPAQRKIDSRLLHELERDQILERVPELAITRHSREDGNVVVDLDAFVDSDLLGWIELLGGSVESSFPRWNAVRATLPMEQLEALAELAQVRSVRPADPYMTQMLNTTEGDVAHATDVARTQFGVDGTGVKVGAMSDSVDALAALQASGDLPPGVTVLAGQSGNPGSSEGTALLEIVHDLAPGSELFFATGQGGQAQMAQNILDLAAAGCTVIVDDVLYFAESVFQDGVIAQAVDEVAAAGVAYFSAAGNSGNLAAGTAGVWEGDYAGIALPALLNGFGISAHDFGGGANSNEVTVDTPFFFTLQWSDANDSSANDYDLYLLDATLSTLLAASTTTQNGTQDPFEAIDSTGNDDTGNRLVVVKFAGDDRFLHLNTHRGQLGAATNGQIFGHPAADGAIAVGAVNVATAGGGPFTGGAANPIEPFSSDGPRRIFFEPDGTPVGGASAVVSGVPTKGVGGPVVRDKPEIAAADGVMTGTPGFNPFFGTSASSPHAAGIAALLKQQNPALNALGVEEKLTDDALDIGIPGFDETSGFGIPTGPGALDGLDGFGGDPFSFFANLTTPGGTMCLDPHQSGTGNNIVPFDGASDDLADYNNGTMSSLVEFGTIADSGEFEVEFFLSSDDDLFPEGFDNGAGILLTSACLEIGKDDPLEGDVDVQVQQAQIEFFSNSVPIGTFDATAFFGGDPWNGSAVVPIDGLAGLDLDHMRIILQLTPGSPNEIFSDGFESGDTSSWVTQD